MCTRTHCVVRPAFGEIDFRVHLVLLPILARVSSCSLKRSYMGAGEMTQELKELSALAEDLGLVPSTGNAANNHLELRFQGTQDSLPISLGTACKRCVDRCGGQTAIHIK